MSKIDTSPKNSFMNQFEHAKKEVDLFKEVFGGDSCRWVTLTFPKGYEL